MSIILSANNISKTYYKGGESIKILKDASLEVYNGEVVGLIGQSGSGKSSLLHILGLLDTADSGSLKINEKECKNLSEDNKNKIRSKDIGFIYQFHHLLSGFSALENVAMPLRIQGEKSYSANNKAMKLLKSLGLEKRTNHLSSQLSGGEQQRVAIARAIVTKPSLILADEPTGNLDPENSSIVFNILIEAVMHYGLSILIVTHNMDLVSHLPTVYSISGGAIVRER